jgi:hypothetical protein
MTQQDQARQLGADIEAFARIGCGGENTRWSFSDEGLRRTIAAALASQPKEAEKARVIELFDSLSPDSRKAVVEYIKSATTEAPETVEQFSPRASLWGSVYDAASRLIAAIGFHGERSTRDSEVIWLQECLRALDGGEHMPGLTPTVRAAAPTEAQAVPAEILAIARRLHTQDNRITSQPAVRRAAEEKCRRPGGRLSTSSGCWVNGDSEDISDAEDVAKLEAAFARLARTRLAHVASGIAHHWEFVTGCLTEQGCKDFIACNGHNLNEPRIYAYSAYRNAEFIARAQVADVAGRRSTTRAAGGTGGAGRLEAGSD